MEMTWQRQLGALALAASLVGVPTWAVAQAPSQLPIQGFLTDASGVAVDGEETITVRVFDADVGGTMLFEETQSLMVDEGYFSAYLGDTASLDLAIFRDTSSTYVEVEIGGTVLSPRIQLATVPYAAYAEHAGTAASLEGMAASDFAESSHGHAWSELSGVPADLADGDDDTTYSAGAGLALTGTTFSLDASSLQSRVSGTCAAGSSIRAIAADGTVTCEADDVGPSYAAGTGLSLSGTTFSVDSSAVQSRVSATCAAGSSIRAIAADGTVTCETDDDTTYTAGTGITVVGSTVSLARPVLRNAYWDNADPTGYISQGNWLGLRFRIVGGDSGRLELSMDAGATWGTVCDDSFTENDNAADVVCRSLGYSSGVVLPSASTPDGTGSILIDDIVCPPAALSIAQCRVRPLGSNNCNHSEDVGVTCTF